MVHAAHSTPSAGAHPSNSIERTSTGIATGRVAMWWFLASEVAIFGGLIMCYVLARVAHPEWSAQAAHTLNLAGALNTVVLLSSSLSAVLAHSAATRGETDRVVKLLAATIFGGVMFLCVKSFEYHHEWSEGFTPMAGTFWSFYYFMTGLHAAHVIAGMSALTYVLVNVRRGKLLEGVEYAGMYWHLVDVVWIFLFPLLYLAS